MPRRQYTVYDRVTAITEAIFSLDPKAYRQAVVRDAFEGSDGAEVAFHLLRQVERDSRLALLVQIQPAVDMLDWTAIRAEAEEAYKLKLYERPVLGPKFHWRTIEAAKQILSWVDGQADALPRALQEQVSTAVADLLCYLADRHYGLSHKIRKKVPKEVFNERAHRAKYEQRMRNDLGLFAVALAHN